jgi:hypothetical protein
MSYMKVEWIHSHACEPVLLYSELDEERWEKRKVEIFANGHCGYASSTESAGSTRLGEIPVPCLPEIATDPQFKPTEITQQEFEEIWTAALSGDTAAP